MAQTPEGRVKAAVKKVLKQKGAWFYMPVQNGMGVVGIPDFVCCWRGRFLGIETKAPGKRRNLSANQAMQLGLIDDAEGLTLVVDDVQQLIDFFDGLTC